MLNRSPTRSFFRSRWLAAVFGLAVISPTVNGQEQRKSIRFCSYNLKNWLSMDRAYGEKVNMQSKPEKEKEAVIATILAIKPDVLGVCEIGTKEDLNELQDRLKLAGLDLPHAEHTHGGDMDRMLGLLSAFPITAKNSQTDLTYRLGDQVIPVKRGILDATISVQPGFDFKAVGVHLKSKRDIPGVDQSMMRRNEAFLLRQHLNKAMDAEPTVKVLAYGDFNSHRNEESIDEIQGDRAVPEKAMHDILLRDANGEVWTHFWDDADDYGRLDYFFVNQALRPYVNAKQSFIYTNRDFMKASDHRPIVLTIDMKK